MKQFKKYAILMAVPLFLVGCGNPELENGQEVIAEIDGYKFTADELFDAMLDDYGTGVLVNLVNENITEAMLSDDEKKEAEELAQSEFDSYKAMYETQWESFLSSYGFASDEDFLNTLSTSQKQTIALEKYIASDVITEEDINEYYEESIFGEVTARHILIEPTVTDDMTGTEIEEAEEAALQQAKDLIEELKDSENLEEDFSNLAKEHSDDPGSKDNGGLYENFTNESGFVTEFWEGALNLEVGSVSEPIETEFGYHIIYKVSQNEKPSLEDVKTKIIESLTTEILSDSSSFQVYWAALREKNGFKIHDNDMQEVYDFSLDAMN